MQAALLMLGAIHAGQSSADIAGGGDEGADAKPGGEGHERGAGLCPHPVHGLSSQAGQATAPQQTEA